MSVPNNKKLATIHFKVLPQLVLTEHNPTILYPVFLTHPCRRQPLKIFFISNDRGRSLFEAFDWLFICVDPSDVRDLRVNVVEIEMP